MNWLNRIKHLLPTARAWRLIVDKQLRQFFDGLGEAVGQDAEDFIDGVYTDLDPQLTRALDKWETQFALPASGLTEQQRRDRLDATWKALGGQDPRYLQDTLQAAGFDVFIHEWWEPTSRVTGGSVNNDDVPVARNPLLVLSDDEVTYLTEAGEALAEAGEAIMEAGNTVDIRGYPLVNKITESIKNVISLAGEAVMEAGEVEAEAGQFDGFIFAEKAFPIPTDPGLFPFFLYIGGATYPELAQVDPKRRNEFETLCLKICPTEQWLGILAEYV